MEINYQTFVQQESMTPTIMRNIQSSLYATGLSNSDSLYPLILDGGEITQTSSTTYSVTAGTFRVQSQTEPGSGTVVPGVFSTSAVANLTATDGQYIVARIVVSPLVSNNISITGGVIAVTTVSSTTDVILGIADSTNNYVARSNDMQSLNLEPIDLPTKIISDGSDYTILPTDRNIFITGTIFNTQLITLPTLSSMAMSNLDYIFRKKQIRITVNSTGGVFPRITTQGSDLLNGNTNATVLNIPPEATLICYQSQQSILGWQVDYMNKVGGSVSSLNNNFYSKTAGVDVETDIISRSGGFTGFKNGWNVELGQSTANGLRVRTATTNVGVSLYSTAANISGISFEDYNNTSASNLEIVDVPGSRIKMVTSQGVNSPLVVQSDLTINQIVIGNTSFLVRKDRMVDRYHYHLSGRITGNQAGGAWTSILSMGTIGVDYTKILGTFTGVATFEVTADAGKGQSLGYAKSTDTSPNLEVYITVTGNMGTGSIAVFSLDFTTTL
jgi:hypothetical protein